MVIRISNRLRHRERLRGLIPAGKRARLPDIAADPRQPGRFQHRADVVQQSARDPAAVDRRHRHRHQPAQRCANRDEAGDPDLIQQGIDIGDILPGGISPLVRCVFAAAPPAHVGAQHAPLPREPRCQVFEVAGIAGQPRQTHQRRPVAAAGIVAIMQPQPVGAIPPAIGICAHAIGTT